MIYGDSGERRNDHSEVLLLATPNERNALFAFLLIEGFAVMVFGGAFGVMGALGGPEQTIYQAFPKYSAMWGSWCGAVSIPASIAWMFVRTATGRKALPRPTEIVRVLSVEFALIALIAVVYVELGAPFNDESPQWSEVGVFGKVFLVMSLAVIFCCILAGRDPDRRAAQEGVQAASKVVFNTSDPSDVQR